MKPKELANQLKTYNKWRRGCEKTPQPSPRELGILIDRTVQELLKPKFTIEEILKAGKDGEINHFDTEHICNVLMRKV